MKEIIDIWCPLKSYIETVKGLMVWTIGHKVLLCWEEEKTLRQGSPEWAAERLSVVAPSSLCSFYKSSDTKDFTIIEVEYSDWYITNVILMVSSCDKSVVQSQLLT